MRAAIPIGLRGRQKVRELTPHGRQSTSLPAFPRSRDTWRSALCKLLEARAMGRFSFASRRSSPLRRRTQGRDGARPAVVVDEVRPHAEATSEACLESPVTGGAQPGFAIALAGWALGLGAAIRTIEVVAEGSVHARVPVDGARPDVGSAHPGIPHADRSGFRGAIGALDLPQRFELILEAVVEDGTRSPLWTVRGRREPVLEPRAHGLRPIVIRFTGRTGSTFLTRLLDQHSRSSSTARSSTSRGSCRTGSRFSARLPIRARDSRR